MKKSVALNSFRHPFFVRGDGSNLYRIERRVNSRKGQERGLSQPQLSKSDEQTSTAEVKPQSSVNDIQLPLTEAHNA